MTAAIVGALVVAAVVTIPVMLLVRRDERRFARHSDDAAGVGYGLTPAGQAAADALIEAVLNGRKPVAVRVVQHPCGAYRADVYCEGDATEEAEAIAREATA